ncbi:MAG: carbon-nitrogen family hydrolase [Butyricicoccus pullicaecorum]|nr:carbon-nitrogen family hydrolase [Butyricicoccus pullicaecorum]
MKITCLQMDMKFGLPAQNFSHAEHLIDRAMQENPDVLVLPETWNTGFFPKEHLARYSCQDGDMVKRCIGSLAEKYHVHIVAGSVSNVRGGNIYNTAMVFDRSGQCIAEYDKTHLFTPMGEHNFYTGGDHLCRFLLDGIPCAVIICYDVRFPELVRTLCLSGIDLLFVVSQWPRERIPHLQTLTAARAIENQIFVACCNSCGTAEQTVFGGHSSILDPFGNILVQAGSSEELVSADCDFQILSEIRSSIPVFRDRHPELYTID